MLLEMMLKAGQERSCKESTGESCDLHEFSLGAYNKVGKKVFKVIVFLFSCKPLEVFLCL